MLSRALDAELCRSGGVVQVVEVERGECGERRGLENHTLGLGFCTADLSLGMYLGRCTLDLLGEG